MADRFEILMNAANAEILREKTLRYKRNALLISLVLSGMTWFNDLDFSSLNILGIKLSASESQNEWLVVALLWMALLYNLIYLTAFTYRDFRRWIAELTQHWPQQTPLHEQWDFFPQLRMYYRLLPGSGNSVQNIAQMRYGGNVDRFIEWQKFEPDKHRMVLVCYSRMQRELGDSTVPENSPAFTVSIEVVKATRRQVQLFVFLEIVPVLGVLAFAFAGLFI